MKSSHPSRRHLLQAVAALGASSFAAAFAQDNKLMRVIVPFPTGGNGDILARLVGKHLGDRLNRTVIVEAKPGAATMIGSEFVARAAPDGNTLLLTSSSLMTLPLSKKGSLRFAVDKDLVPVTQAVMLPLVLVANNDAPFKTVAEMIAWAKANPSKLNVGVSPGLGGASHLAWERLRLMAGITSIAVPYQGGAPVVQALLGNQVPVMVEGVATSSALVKEGKLRMLAVLSEKRSIAMPSVPTVAEQGVPGYEAENWMGFLAPAGTPRETITLLQNEINAVLALPDVRARILQLGMEPVGTTSDAFARNISTGMITWAKVVQDAGVKFD
jgi:tripartite-type tricarboxylate transporter receptor subunit TctC